MSILNEIFSKDWKGLYSTDTQTQAINRLENGGILFFPKLAFALRPEEKTILSPFCAHPRSKNISFNADTEKVHGAADNFLHTTLLKTMLQRYANSARELICTLLPAYANAVEVGRTSFRPAQIAGRATSYRQDDTRLHVDAFPASPIQGRRILRVFTNINPEHQPRHWRVGEPFMDVAKKFLPLVKRQKWLVSRLLKLFNMTKSYRTEYDHIMLQIHDRMKADLEYQSHAPQTHIYFPANTTWIVQTDHVSHAAMAGQYVLEQTFYLPVNAMANPELSPLRSLESLTGRRLV